jgi:hypothetical protein
MIRSATAKSDLSPHAAAIGRWDNEGGASCQVPEQEKIEKVRKYRRPARRDEPGGFLMHLTGLVVDETPHNMDGMFCA